ncbi:MAG: hypothetical protein QNJ94_18255 [Alphaproteobacteria bacterium]|nr:hypothetical protein [Alphaproteobacteria bacterium]
MQDLLRKMSDATVPAILALAVCAGVVFPQVSALAAPLIFPALFLLLTFSLSLVTDRPMAILTKPDPAVWGIMLWQMAFIPLLVVLIGWAVDLAPDLHLMVLATAVSGTVFAAPTIAHLLKLNSRLPINGMVLSTFLMPVTLLMFGESLEGGGLSISMSQYVSRVAIFLLVPLLLSVMINRFVRKLPEPRAPTIFLALRVGAVAALLTFAIGIMDGVGEKIETDPERVLIFLSITIGFALATVVGTIALFWSMGRDLTIAATILSVHRNVGLTYALIGTAAGHDFAIYVAISQMPMFLFPLVIHLAQMFRPGGAIAPDQRAADVPSR